MPTSVRASTSFKQKAPILVLVLFGVLAFAEASQADGILYSQTINNIQSNAANNENWNFTVNAGDLNLVGDRITSACFQISLAVGEATNDVIRMEIIPDVGTAATSTAQLLVSELENTYCFDVLYNSLNYYDVTASTTDIRVAKYTDNGLFNTPNSGMDLWGTDIGGQNVTCTSTCGDVTQWSLLIYGNGDASIDSFDLLTHVFTVTATSTTNRRIGQDNPECSAPSSIFEILSTKGLIYVFCTVFMPRQSDVDMLTGLDDYLLSKSPFYYITDTLTLKDELFQNTATTSQITFNFNSVTGNSILSGSTTAAALSFMPNSLSNNAAVTWVRSLLSFMLWASTIYIIFIFAIKVIQ